MCTQTECECFPSLSFMRLQQYLIFIERPRIPTVYRRPRCFYSIAILCVNWHAFSNLRGKWLRPLLMHFPTRIECMEWRIFTNILFEFRIESSMVIILLWIVWWKIRGNVKMSKKLTFGKLKCLYDVVDVLYFSPVSISKLRCCHISIG